MQRFLRVDPLSLDFPWWSPYQFAGNLPIWSADLDGLEPIVDIESGVLVGYKVQDGQGPTQISEDINNPETQAKYGYCLIKPVDWLDIVYDNYDSFRDKSRVKTLENKYDEEYKKMNINPGDILELCLSCDRDEEPAPPTITLTPGTLKVRGGTVSSGADVFAGVTAGKTIYNIPIDAAYLGSWEAGKTIEIYSLDGVGSINPSVDFVHATGGLVKFNGLLNNSVVTTLENTMTTSVTGTGTIGFVLNISYTHLSGESEYGNSISGNFGGAGIGLSVLPVDVSSSTTISSKIILINPLKTLSDSLDYAIRHRHKNVIFENFVDENTIPIDSTNN